MEVSIFLAKVIGFYYIIMAIGVLINYHTFEKMVDHLMDNKAVVFISAALSTILGLLIVNVHNIWDGSWRVWITLIGWLVLVKGIVYVVIPDNELNSIVRKWIHNKHWYILWLIIILILGLYLVGKGFNAL